MAKSKRRKKAIVSSARVQATALRRQAAAKHRRGRSAFPPPDNPLFRHEELSVDREIVSAPDEAPRAGAAMVLLAEARRAPGAARRRPAADSGHDERLDMAARRLQALSEARPVNVASAASLTETAFAGAAAAPAALGAGPVLMAPVAGVSNWVQLGPSAIPRGQTYGGARVLVTGRVTAIVVHPTAPDTVYVGTAQGGVWKTTDGGAHWTPKSDNEVSLAIGALAMDPADPQILYAGTGEGNFSLDSYYGAGVLKTTDGGNTWSTLATSTFLGARFCGIAVTPGTPARVFAATTFGLYRSTNGGTDWPAMTGGLPLGAAVDVVIDPMTPATAYAAFRARGIYKTTNAGAASPTWTQLAGGLPTATSPAPAGFTRIALALSPSSPQTLYALFANNRTTNPAAPDYYQINKLYVTTDGGAAWTAIALPGGHIGGQGFYNLSIAVDPTTPDIIYLSGVSLWRGTRDTMTGAWTIVDIGGLIHPDNHALAFHPTNPLTLYAGNDGGIYKSVNGGTSWDDSINREICIAQFEFIDQHPDNDAVVFGGTQDNGTEQYRNSPVFYHAADGDGGVALIDQTQPRNVLHTYYGPSPERSTLGGTWGDYAATHLNWTDVSPGLSGNSLFYPPMTLNRANQSDIAFGTDQIFLDAAQGTGGWPVQIALPGIGGGVVSAIEYVSANLIYVGTNNGRVYRLSRSGAAWTATAIHAAPLPGSWVWDIATLPGDVNTVVLVMSGFGIAHVWRGAVPASGVATWSDVSGTGAVLTPTTPGRLPDIPTNALAIEPGLATTMYLGTDVGVFGTANGGTTWFQMSEGLPNCAVFDLRLHNPSRLLRAATHGRGLWERRLDVASMPAVDIYVRDHLMHSGRTNPSPTNVPAAFEDPLHYVSLGDALHWWMCADIKVDALEGAPPAYQMNAADVDYVAFESRLQHRSAQRGRTNRVYVQVNNRGFQFATNVTVKILYANASPGLPPLPADFWTAFPANSASTAVWTPIGSPQTIPLLPSTEPVVLQWDWPTPTSAADHTCVLAVIDSPDDPIPAAAKIFNVNQLVNAEKRVGLKNLHVINALPGTGTWTMLELHAPGAKPQALRVLPSAVRGWSFGVLLQKNMAAKGGIKLEGASRRKPTEVMLKELRKQLGAAITSYDTASLITVADLRKGMRIQNLKVARTGARILLRIDAASSARGATSLTLLQEDGAQVSGGNTFVLRAVKKR